ncbi:hypothetical protein [Pseudomonas kairouanensis]|uniref:hypothetical protein n=1 Tax=Pseudomonas kairouanensis TaxID=2293832 RepID=UPI00142EB5C5|nr:hypothetical protein [Pseudomonas kairouanensis]
MSLFLDFCDMLRSCVADKDVLNIVQPATLSDVREAGSGREILQALKSRLVAGFSGTASACF